MCPTLHPEVVFLKERESPSDTSASIGLIQEEKLTDILKKKPVRGTSASVT
jgi:hypothetical protein